MKYNIIKQMREDLQRVIDTLDKFIEQAENVDKSVDINKIKIGGYCPICFQATCICKPKECDVKQDERKDNGEIIKELASEIKEASYKTINGWQIESNAMYIAEQLIKLGYRKTGGQ